MKTLILNGSPRKHGDTAALLAEIKKHLHGDIISINAYFDSIAACTDCRFCWEHTGCAFKDNMQRVYDALETSDNIIIASPIYFSMLTGKLLDVASRFQIYFASKYIRHEEPALHNKKGLLVFTGGGDGSYKPAEETSLIILKLINAQHIGTVLSLHTDKLPASKDLAALNDAHKYAEQLNRLSLV